MKVKLFVVLALMNIETLATAQEFPLGIRAQALGGASVAKGREAESLLDNPAALANLNGSTLTIFYTNPFGIKELRLNSFSASTNFANCAFGAAFVDFGNMLYRDRRLHLAVARHFLSAPNLMIGVSGVLRQLRISGYGDDRAMLLNLGTQFRVSDSFTFGSALTNLLNATIGQQNEKLPRSVCFGFAFLPASTLTLQMDVYKQNAFPEEWRLGIEINPLPPLLLRIGTGTNPDRLTCGFALRLLKFSLQFTAFSHTDLGWTEQFAVTLMSR
jgi:hypothetical protein